MILTYLIDSLDISDVFYSDTQTEHIEGDKGGVGHRDMPELQPSD